MEGFLVKRAMKSGRNWKRRYFILKNNALAYYDGKPSDEDSFKPKGLVEITDKTVVRISPVNKTFAFEVVTKPQVLCISAESKELREKWMEAINAAIASQKKTRNGRLEEERRGWLVKRAVRSGRNWKKRWFVLRNSRLSYYEQPPSGPSIRPKGVIEITETTKVNTTVATLGSILRGKKNVFSIEAQDQVLHLSAEHADEMNSWIYTINLIVLRKLGIVDTEAVKVGMWLHQKDLFKFVKKFIVEAGFATLAKVRSAEETSLQNFFHTAQVSMHEARNFSAAIKELQTIAVPVPSPSDLVTPPTESEEKPASFSARRSIVRTQRSIVPPPSYSSLPEPEIEVPAEEFAVIEVERRAYSWGANREQQLGTGEMTSQIATPSYIPALKKSSEPSRVYAGSSFMMAITRKDGHVFSWGAGPLGLGESQKQSSRPYLITSLRNIRIVDISLGAMHVAAVSADGDLFMWGHGHEGQLGLGKEVTEVHKPQLVPTLGVDAGEPIQSVCCGSDHTLAISYEHKKIFSFGMGKHGRLGLGGELNEYRPRQIDSIAGVPIVRVAAGSSFSMALSNDGRSCWWWGAMGSMVGPLVPIRLVEFDDRCIDEIYAGGSTGMFLVGLSSDRDEGEIIPSSVYSMGAAGPVLGHGDSSDTDKLIPTRIDALEGHGVVMLSLGTSHAAALCDDGRLLMWGSDTFGELGNGYLVDLTSPHTSISVAYYKYAWVSCGENCTTAIAEFDPYYDDEVDLDGNLYEAGTTMAPPPPPEESLLRDIGQEEELQKLMQSLAELTNDEIDEDGLPPGSSRFNKDWLEHTDPKTGKKYYENIHSGKVQWKAPE